MNEDDYKTWPRKKFEKLPYRNSWDEDVRGLDAIVLLPTRRKHDSGYACMDFVAIRNNKPLCLLSGCSDVVHIGGISAVIKHPASWSIDCLHPSGLMRLFCMSQKIMAGVALSSFEVFAEGRVGDG